MVHRPKAIACDVRSVLSHARRYRYTGIALCAVGIGGVASLAVSPPKTVTLAVLLLLGGVIEAGAGFANLGRRDHTSFSALKVSESLRFERVLVIERSRPLQREQTWRSSEA